jgi:putative Mg2+ transporter-C (MgtC) family protein
MFTILSLRLGGELSPVRIAAHMVTGVGFICAGVVMQEGERIVGLTTAATIWLTAALGMAIGGGHYLLASIATLVAIIILGLFPKVEERIYAAREMRTYKIMYGFGLGKFAPMQEEFEQSDLQVKKSKQMKTKFGILTIWEIYGTPENHDNFVEKLILDPDIKSFHY